MAEPEQIEWTSQGYERTAMINEIPCQLNVNNTTHPIGFYLFPYLLEKGRATATLKWNNIPWFTHDTWPECGSYCAEPAISCQILVQPILAIIVLHSITQHQRRKVPEKEQTRERWSWNKGTNALQCTFRVPRTNENILEWHNRINSDRSIYKASCSDASMLFAGTRLIGQAGWTGLGQNCIPRAGSAANEATGRTKSFYANVSTGTINLVHKTSAFSAQESNEDKTFSRANPDALDRTKVNV